MKNHLCIEKFLNFQIKTDLEVRKIRKNSTTVKNNGSPGKCIFPASNASKII